jgi:hypothetical protein
MSASDGNSKQVQRQVLPIPDRQWCRAMLHCCGTFGEIGFGKIVVRLMKFPLPSSFRRSPIDRAADYPYPVS